MCRYHDIFPLFPFCGCYWFAEQQIIIIWIWVCDFLTSPSSHFKVVFFCFSILCSCPLVCVSAGTWRFRWGTWACLTPQRSITEASSSLIWKRPWLNWATICSASSFTCTGESIETHGKKSSAWNCFFFLLFFFSCHVLLFSSSMILALINDWSTPDPSALRPPPRALCSHKPACRMQSDRRSACCVCCHQFHFMTLMKSGVSGTVYCCNSNKKWSRQKAISQKWAKFLLSSLLLCRAVIF